MPVIGQQPATEQRHEPHRRDRSRQPDRRRDRPHPPSHRRRRTAAADRRAVEAAPAPALDSTALDRLAARFGTDTGTAVPWMYR